MSSHGAHSARIGVILRKHGELSGLQVSTILMVQRKTGRPFGELAERMFGVSRAAVERAWADQYRDHGTAVNLESIQIDAGLNALLSRRQAWQFQLLPLYRRDGQLHLATTVERLPRASAFAWRRFGEPVMLWLAEADPLHNHLTHRYPWPAMAARRASLKPAIEPAVAAMQPVEIGLNPVKCSA